MIIGPLKLKAQIFCGDSAAMGPGKAELLEHIDREGSISAGARAMGLSYRRAWDLVSQMNSDFSERLIDTFTGGKGNGARLTPAGRAVLEAFRGLENDMAKAADSDQLSMITAMLRASGKAAAE